MIYLDLNSKLSDTVFCALDLETTGMNASVHKIVEIGMVKFTLNGILDEYESLVNPLQHIPQSVTQIHGITNEMVSLSVPISSIIKKVESFLKGTILVIQNPGFDFSFLSRAFNDSGIRTDTLYAIDTVRMSNLAYPQLINHKLNTVSAHIGFKFKHHRAFSDANACMQIFLSSLNILDPENKFTFSNLISIHGNFVRPKLNFGAAKRIEKINGINGIKIGIPVIIKYKDSEGHISQREIIPRSIVNEGSAAYVVAYCKLRREERLFKINRITEIINTF
jgi:DNA polymerase III epsilon subunit family exonuclease